MFTYISLGLLAVTGLFVLINLLKGVIRGLKKTIGTLVAIIISAVVAAIVTGILCNPTSSLMVTVMDLIKGAIGEGDFQDIFAIEELGEAINYYISMVAAPFVFVALYVVLSLIVGIIVGIVVRFIPTGKKKSEDDSEEAVEEAVEGESEDDSKKRPKKKSKKKSLGAASRLGGLGVGIVCGILASLLILMPIVGVLNIVISVSQSETFEAEELAEMFEGSDRDTIYAIYDAGCGWIFNSLASADYHGERVYLKNDIMVILDVIGNIEGLAGDASEFGEDQVDALNAIVDHLDRSILIKHTLSGLLSEMASKWAAGESFMNMEKIDAGELLNPVLDTIFHVLATSDETNIIADMHTLTGILEVFVKHDMFANSGDYAQMLDKFSHDGVIAELITVANRNERMSVLSDEITQLSIRALASTIGIPNDANERYDLLMSDIANTLNDSYYMSEEERLEYVEVQVEDALDRYGVEIGGHASEDIAASIVGDLGGNSSLEGSDVKEFFMIYAIANGNADSSASINGFDFLSDDEFKIVCNPDGTISVGGVVLKNYTYANYSSSQAYTMGKNHVDIGDAATLYSAEAMKSSLITFDDILSNVKKYSDCADPDAEAQKISDLLGSAVDIFGSNEGNLDKTKVLSDIGGLLDKMQETEIFGEQVTADILKAIFQTDDVRGELGLSMSEVNNFTDKLNETSRGEDSSYTSTTQTVSTTVDMMDKLNDQTISKEERTDTTKKLLEDISSDTAELLSTMTTPSMMIQYGSTEEKADVVSNSVSTLLDNMAKFEPDTDSEEGRAQHDSEAHAVNTLLQMAIDTNDSDARALFSNDEVEGKTGNTAGEFVELLVSSQVVSDTLLETVFEDGNTDNPFGVIPTERDKEALNEELVDYYELNKDSGIENLEMKLNAVAIISGMEPIFDIDQ